MQHKMLSWSLAIGLFLETVVFAEGTFSTSAGPIIPTKAGHFQGFHMTLPWLEQPVYGFLGIPYAKPPTGRLRFTKPIPVDFIPGIYRATTKPPACFQLDVDIRFPWADRDSPMTEDCLYLNIWTPKNTQISQITEELKPVMVWIHGGGYHVGSTALDLYDGQVLSSLGDVVVVTFNHRLGPFGYLNFLTDDAPGNVAFYDMLLALRWVQTNIEFFGGDPKRVTLFGESTGAMSAGFLAMSTLSRGLFHRLILESGSPYAPPLTRPTAAAENANLLAALVGCSNDTFTVFTNPKEVLSCMRNVPPAELTKTYYRQEGSQKERIAIFFRPQFWDEFIPKHPIDIFLSQNYHTYDMLIGVAQVEGLILFPVIFPEIFQEYSEGKLTLNKILVGTMLGGLFNNYGLTTSQKAVDFYLKDIRDDDEQSALRALSNGIGDPILTCPAIYYAERYSEKGTPVWFYRFDHEVSTSPWPGMGGAHFEEIQFVFGMPVRYPERYQDEEIAFSKYMIRTWTNFAKSEDLTLRNGSPWPNFLPWKPKYATLVTCEQTVGCGIRQEACEFWRPYYRAWKRKKAKKSKTTYEMYQ